MAKTEFEIFYDVETISKRFCAGQTRIFIKGGPELVGLVAIETHTRGQGEGKRVTLTFDAEQFSVRESAP
jgi:hypothetical protein